MLTSPREQQSTAGSRTRKCLALNTSHRKWAGAAPAHILLRKTAQNVNSPQSLVSGEEDTPASVEGKNQYKGENPPKPNLLKDRKRRRREG